MPQSNDFYKALGVSRGASDDEIRSAYRSLARKFHPDVSDSPDASRRFKEITEAYEVLSDPEKRKAYDRFGRAGVGAGARGGPGAGRGGASGFGGFDAGDFGDLFEQVFSSRAGGAGASPFAGARPAHRPGRGQDIHKGLTASFMTVARGGTEEVTIAGSDGTPQRLSVKIPAGIENGTRLRLRGKGRPGPVGGPAGDVIVTVTVGKHPWFRREGLDVLLDVPLTICEAALGATVHVPLLTGAVDLKIPPGTGSGQHFRVRGKGITDEKGRSGDFHAVVQIVTPQELSPHAREGMERLAAELKNPRDTGPWADTD